MQFKALFWNMQTAFNKKLIFYVFNRFDSLVLKLIFKI
jgi:hypothetical protein